MDDKKKKATIENIMGRAAEEQSNESPLLMLERLKARIDQRPEPLTEDDLKRKVMPFPPPKF